jgi:E3 ubiquitin-protein ligase EDD1
MCFHQTLGHLLTSAGEGESIVLLRDGNRALYPLARDSLDAIRDPHWLDLPPVRCLAAGLHPLSSGGSGGGLSASSAACSSSGPGSITKTQVAVVVLVMESQVFSLKCIFLGLTLFYITDCMIVLCVSILKQCKCFCHQVLMSRVLRCDSEGVGLALEALDQEFKLGSTSTSGAAVIAAERCDGNRNVLHACVAMCAPTSNKDDSSTGVAGSTDSGASLEPINVISNALSSKSVSLREMMRRATRSSALGLDRDFIQDVQPSNQPEEPIPTLSWPPESFEANSGDEDSLIGSLSQSAKSSAGPSTAAGTSGSSYIVDPAERRANALVILRLLCESAAMSTHLKSLLSAKDAQGQTAFMLAVTLRAYPAALAILDAIHKVRIILNNFSF